MTTDRTGAPRRDPRDDDALLRARLKRTLPATPPDALVARVRALALSGEVVAGGAVAAGAAASAVGRGTPPAPRRVDPMRAPAAFLPFIVGIVLLVSLLVGLLDAFPPLSIAARLAGAASREGSPQLGGVGLLLLVALAPLGLLGFLAELSRGAPALRRFVR